MRRAISAILSTLAVIVGGFLFVGDDTRAQSISNSTYAAVPPFVSANTIPNVIVLMDNSGSMTNRACEPISPKCGLLPGGAPSNTANFAATTTFSGLFNPLFCYNYVSGQTRFEEGTAKATVGTACPATQWDGNLLNWITLRRFDAVQIAMMGGVCAVARDAAGLCPTSGSPSLITLKGLTIFDSTGRGHETTPAVPSAGADGYVGRVPVALTATSPANLYFHLRGGQSGMQGTFCIDDENSPPSNTNTLCNRDGTSDDSDAFIEGIDGVTAGPAFTVRVARTTEPQGVIQQVGNQARFGLMVFSSNHEGGQMLVGVGLRQTINYAGTGIETFNTNTAAMIDAIEEAFPNTWTPLAEQLYDAISYVAQVNTPFSKASGMNGYAFPLAFSPGSNMGGSINVGRIGSTEITALTGSESCPSGYIPNACGRDPYFFGSNHSPAWASPSTQVSCCQTFILILTDGEPTEDRNTGIPNAVREYAHAHHGEHCKVTAASPTIHAPNGVCNTDPLTPNATLLGEHKIGSFEGPPPSSGTGYPDNGSHWLDDVAFFGHTEDLRQASIPEMGSGHDIDGTQIVTVYTFFAFGNISGREILMQTAKMGGFDDVNANGIPDAGEWDKVNNVTGASGGDGVPDTYFESSNVDELRNKLTATLASILQRSTSGTSLSVLATSTTGEGALYQSFFFPKADGSISPPLTNVYWVGYTQALFLDTFGNLREDTNGDGRLVYKDDLIIRTKYNASTGKVDAELFADILPSPDGDGLADSTTATSTVELKDIKPIWEAGNKLAMRDDTTTPRKILTWLDLDNDGIVDSSEQMSFADANKVKLQPYLRAATSDESGYIISWIRGNIVAGPSPIPTYRNRELLVGGSFKTWKYGDTIHSTPTVVAAPRERTDIVYGDTSYSDFFKLYRTRRQVAYVGGNDGMLHAFNVGFYNAGDDPSTTSKVEHGWFTTQKPTAPFVTNTPAIGEELWAFIPQELLPQLKFLTQGDYQHVYYVDQKPKITDARIFCDGSAGAPTSPNCVTGQGSGSSHPNGWGTILIGSFRLGGSCTNCSTGGTQLTVTADFSDPANSNTTDSGDTRSFRSAYFALDITDPELDPKLLWVFTDADMGLTLGYPTMARLRPAGGNKTDNSDARWFMAVGSGPTGYDVGSVQTANLYVVDIVKKATSNTLNTAYYKFPTINTCGTANPNNECSLFGNVVTVDTDLDYRADVFYAGNMICNASTSPCNGPSSGSPPAWKGRFYRLTTGSSANPALGTETDPCVWGVGSGPCARTPSVLLDDFACAGVCSGANDVGPVSAASNVAQDDANKVWVYWGTGRYFANADKVNTDLQHFFGVKDLVVTSPSCDQTTTCSERKDLVNVSNAEVCVIGSTTGSGTCDATSQVSNVTGADGFDSSSGTSNTLQSLMQSKDGWFTTLDDQNALTPTRERSLSQPAIIGGLVFFPTFEPINDICSSSGSSFLYALFYKSGTAYKESVIGTVTQGSNTNVARRQAIGDPGLASGVAVHMGAQGSGGNGSGGGGCQGQLTANIQSSTGSVGQTCMKTAGVPWSYYISWTSQRDS